MKRIFRSIFRVVGIILLSIAALLLLWAGVSQLLSLVEKGKEEQLGVSVEVYGGEMNVYASGAGGSTIVLMPGLGTAAPALDFAPLTEKLAENNRLVVAEPFGYGWSSLTQRERSAENIVEELRAALTAAGEEAPYILMPHSVSGIYAAWYCQHYPEEISAVIGIDCTLPRQVEYFGGGYPTVTNIAKLASPLGISRLLCMIAPATFVSQGGEGVYSDDNLLAQKRLGSRMGYNRCVIDEMNMTGANVDVTKDIYFIGSLPLLFITRPESSHSARDDGKTSRSFYETYISSPDCQQILELDAPHYMHWAQSEAIAQAVEGFLAENIKAA